MAYVKNKFFQPKPDSDNWLSVENRPLNKHKSPEVKNNDNESQPSIDGILREIGELDNKTIERSYVPGTGKRIEQVVYSEAKERLLDAALNNPAFRNVRLYDIIAPFILSKKLDGKCGENMMAPILYRLIAGDKLVYPVSNAIGTKYASDAYNISLGNKKKLLFVEAHLNMTKGEKGEEKIVPPFMLYNTNPKGISEKIGYKNLNDEKPTYSLHKDGFEILREYKHRKDKKSGTTVVIMEIGLRHALSLTVGELIEFYRPRVNKIIEEYRKREGFDEVEFVSSHSGPDRGIKDSVHNNGCVAPKITLAFPRKNIKEKCLI